MSSKEKQLEQKLKNKKAKIAVIGVGYVGLPLANAFAQKGLRVTCIDIDAKKVAAIAKGESYIADLPSQELKRVVRKGLLRASCEYDPLVEADVAIVCVPTPLNRFKDPDVSYIVSATQAIAERFHPGQLVVLESTTYPGTTEEVILPTLE